MDYDHHPCFQRPRKLEPNELAAVFNAPCFAERGCFAPSVLFAGVSHQPPKAHVPSGILPGSMVRTTLFLAFYLAMFAGCTSDHNVNVLHQAIIECNGGSIGLACDSDDDPCTLELCVQVGQNVQCALEELAPDGTPCLSDNQACTADTCESGTCEHSPLDEGTLCDDGLFCTTGTSCNIAGVCGGGEPSCEDNNACTADSCNEGAEQCTNTAAAPGAACDDLDACTDGSTCNAVGTCVGTMPLACNDGSECTADTCNSTTGCVFTPLEDSPCADNFFCTIAEACTIDGNCEGIANCSDSNSCTADSCDELGDVCSNVATPGVSCEDGNECTESDSCDALGVCDGNPVANGTSCGSGGGCIAGGMCTDGSCIGGVPLPNNSPCDDNNACTITDSCTDGLCDGYPLSCFDSDPCTADGCDEVTGCFFLVIEGCEAGPDAGPSDAGVNDAGTGGDSGVRPDAGGEGVLGGGGCNSGGNSGGAAAMLLLGLLVLLRKSKVSWLLAVIVITSFSHTANAQGFDTEIFRPGSSSTAYLSQQSTEVLPAWTLNMGVTLGMANNPLVLRDPDTGEQVMNGVVVSKRHGAYLAAGIGLFGRFELGVALPMVLSQEGQGELLASSPDLNSASLGDLRITLKGRIWQASGFRLAAAVDASLPAGNHNELYGEEGVSTAPQLIAGWNRGRVSAALNVGLRLREVTQVAGLEINDELTTGAGLAVELASQRVWLLAEAYASRALQNNSAENSPAEALLGVRVAVWGPYQLQAAGGVGIGRGYGTPSSRALLGFFYRPPPKAKPITVAPEPEPVIANIEPPAPTPVDSDGDGITDPNDACPLEPEDMDGFEDDNGCPDPDNDGDSILDGDDACPLQAEVVNGIDDEDGCPDEGIITMIEDRVVLGEKVLFDKNRARVKRQGRKALQAIITLYLQHPEWGAMSVEGHADTRGPTDYNLSLSRRRADRVRHEMMDLGMPAEKISSKGFGEAMPIASGDSEEARQTNRRVEFVILNLRKRVEVLTPAPAPASSDTP